MYEDVTYETLMARLLARVPDTLDKREGSVIRTALAPAAAELQNMYLELDKVLDETFADTASRDSLVRRAAERGISPRPATAARLRGVFSREVGLDFRCRLDSWCYRTEEALGNCAYRMVCEAPGSAPNGHLGTLTPVSYTEGLSSAELTELLIPGEDREETEAFRARYFASLNSASFGGNQADYRERTEALEGVAGAKVYPAWNGGGTVKLVILSAAWGAPGTELLASVQAAADPGGSGGQGLGFAPIGHTVTVTGVSPVTVNVSFTAALETGWVWDDVKTRAQAAVDGYFTELCRTWADSERLVVRVSQIEARVLALEGVLDVSGTTLNGSAANLELGPDQIPVRGTVNG